MEVTEKPDASLNDNKLGEEDAGASQSTISSASMANASSAIFPGSASQIKRAENSKKEVVVEANNQVYQMKEEVKETKEAWSDEDADFPDPNFFRKGYNNAGEPLKPLLKMTMKGKKGNGVALRASNMEHSDDELKFEDKRSDFLAVNIPKATVKRIMKSDLEVSKVAADAVFIMSKAAELFLRNFAIRSFEGATRSRRRIGGRRDIGYRDLFETKERASTFRQDWSFLDSVVPPPVEEEIQQPMLFGVLPPNMVNSFARPFFPPFAGTQLPNEVHAMHINTESGGEAMQKQKVDIEQQQPVEFRNKVDHSVDKKT
eukprot:g1541.t1